MDVGCPRCQTEYELDDARVPEEGVTVKCTTCSHVFRVKKKSLVVTLPAKQGDAPPATELPPPPPTREWRIRQPAGNIFACRDLTMLQKWIIEGKVQRDDEISLTGETWKRLGNIPELASFFQIVEDAAKARAYDALRASAPTAPPPATAPPPLDVAPPPTTGGRITDTWRENQFRTPLPATQPQPPPPPPPSVPSRVEVKTEPEGIASVPPPARGPDQPSIRETLRAPTFSTPPPPTREDRPPRPQAPQYQPSDSELERAVRGSGRGKWIALVIVGLAIGGGVGWYFGLYLPEQQRLEEERKAEAQRKADEEARAKLVPPEPIVVVDAGPPDAGEPDAGPPDAGPPDAGPPDAGPPDAGPPDAGEVKKEEKKSFDWYLAQGDRLRDREKAEAALDMYGRAHDLKPERVEPVAGRGLALLDMGNTLAAVAAFEDALKLNARYGPAIMGMAEAYRIQKNNEKAVEWYQRYLDVLPNGSEAEVARNNIERLKK